MGFPDDIYMMRFRIVCRLLNTHTLRYNYPIPCIDECLNDSEHISVLDANSGYRLISVAKYSMDMTAFVSHSGFIELDLMLFYLTKFPETFQRSFDLILANYKWRSFLKYLDDIIVFSNIVEEHLSQLDEFR